jgi:uncharacterized protein (TIGR02391 family)
MPKRTPAQPHPPVVKQFRPEEIDPAIGKLRRRLDEIRAIDPTRVRYDDEAVNIAERNIRSTILEVFGADAPEYHDHQYHRIWHGPMNIAAEPSFYQRGFSEGLKDTEKVLLALVAGIEEKRADLGADPTARVRTAFQHLDLHPRIAGVAADLFRDGHYRNAVLDAAVALTNMVKERSRVHDRDGVALMRHVFTLNAPVLAFNALADQSDRDQQEGLMQLFAGSVQALRNPRAHDLVPDTAEYALESIALLSFLAKHLDRSQRPAP